ncbi:MAG: hypothetical protein ACLUPK_00020 [Veillonella sp.]
MKRHAEEVAPSLPCGKQRSLLEVQPHVPWLHILNSFMLVEPTLEVCMISENKKRCASIRLSKIRDLGITVVSYSEPAMELIDEYL